VRLRATTKGAALLREGRARRVAHLAGPIGELSSGERDALAHAAGILTRVVERLS